ncbi:hypothetical protein DL89DRAFT_96521 [Linderina pennispora]|uniref:Uncharacterized protein n=1 Tax=Linderina pennispora TaxID=61395 RepID=A0A1Y1VRH5_9FUNG|nr:uncharacterized protein DL89DRAFT_96521 [Linderina pennispora]ORX63364.1 hypothetical protein DL89DRAFT_96521 [Linderina pennispora]
MPVRCCGWQAAEQTCGCMCLAWLSSTYKNKGVFPCLCFCGILHSYSATTITLSPLFLTIALFFSLTPSSLRLVYFEPCAIAARTADPALTCALNYATTSGTARAKYLAICFLHCVLSALSVSPTPTLAPKKD